MKVAVFGASGRTGRPLVMQLLERGDEVTALVREPAKLPITHTRLKVVQGDVTNAQLVDEVVAGQDAVISVLGRTKGAAANLLTLAMTNIINAMQQHGVRRLISLTGAGVPDPLDQPKLIDKLIRLTFKLPIGDFRETLQDSLGSVNQIKASNLDWVIVRGPRLTEDPPQNSYKITYVDKQSGIKIARADLAAFMLKLLTDNQYLHKLPVVSY